MYLSPAFES